MLKPEKCWLGLDFSFAAQLQYLLLLITLFITLDVQNGVCVIPESSQEGPLRSFGSYEDVVMFHYNVPKQVIRATWQFAAFMDNSKCSQRKVHIFLKWGSYPVISVNNASFPQNMYINNNDTIEVTIMTTFEPKTTTLVPVYSPEPGDWFVGAYLSPWDEHIHPKGLGHKCSYSLGAVAVWKETHSIENIPLDYQKTIVTTGSISYYKMYIPMDTWKFEIDIWGCNFTLKQNYKFNEACIKDIVIKGRVLPFYNHSITNLNKSITIMDQYTFTDNSPFQDTWYYLMIISSTAIKFNIKVSVSYCPVRTIEEDFIRRYIDAPLYSRASDQLYLENLKEQPTNWYSINRTVNESKARENLISDIKQPYNDLDDVTFKPCTPRYQLVRIKHAQIFTGDYLLQGKEWLTSWLTLTDTYPVVTQFSILPLIDIGGSLDFNVDLEINEALSNQQVKVDICINRGRIPELENGRFICDHNYMTIQLSSSVKKKANILIPYPQPDLWYATFKATCYGNGMPVHCQIEEILVSLNIKLQACAFQGSNSCGEYGTCEEIHKGLLFFTACKCFGGRQGWACTDTTKAVSDFSSILSTLVLIFSNLFFIPAVWIAFKRKLYTEGLVYVCTMSFSAFYHACDQPFMAHCIAKFEALQYCDFFLGRLAFWVTLVSMANIPMQYVSFFHMMGAIIITFYVESNKTGLDSITVPVIIGSFIPLTSYAYDCITTKQIVRSRKIVKLIFGLTLVVIGILLYCLLETVSNYQYVHSMWHIIIAVSLIFLLPVEEDIEKQSSRCNKLLNNTVFNININHQNNHLIDTS